MEQTTSSAHASHLIDLSLPLFAGMPVYPGDPPVSFAPLPAADGFSIAHLSLGTHAGTHLDAPRHAFSHGDGVEAVPLAACVGPARVLDCTHLRRITLPALRARWSNPQPGTRLLLRTDWDQHFSDERYYTDFPGLTVAAARWLVSRRIALLGLETPSLSVEDDSAAHALLLGAGVALVEGLARLREIPGERCWFAALPLPLAGLDGSPVRAVAWV